MREPNYIRRQYVPYKYMNQKLTSQLLMKTIESPPQKDFVENYQQELLNGSNGDASERDRSTPSYAPLQSRLSSYKTYQEKTTLAQKDLPQYDMSEFHNSVLNDRGPEPLTIDDIPRDSAYIRNTVMNLREYGQRSNLSPFLNEVQLYETQKDYRGTENIPTDRLRAEMFLSKADFYRRNLYVDDIGNMRTEQVSDFERRDLIWKQQNDSRKRTILFDDEKLNYNTLAGAINPRTTKTAVNDAVWKYQAIGDQLGTDQKYQVKQKVWNDVHDDRFNFQAVPDHTPQVADYSQVFITNAGKMPLNYLYAFSKQRENDRKQFEEQQEEFNANQKSRDIRQYIIQTTKPTAQKSKLNTQDQDQSKNESIIGSMLGKLRVLPKHIKQYINKEDKQLNQHFELLIALKRQKRDLCNQYYNRLQCVEDSMKALNLESNLVYRMPHQVDQKAVADLQIVEDFLVVSRDAPKMSKQAIRTDNSHVARDSQFEQSIARLVEKYLGNPTLIPKHLVQSLNNHQEQTQQSGKSSFQNNKKQLQQQLDYVLSAFKPEAQQILKQQKKQTLLSLPTPNLSKNRLESQKNNHQFSRFQDPQSQRILATPKYSVFHKQTDLNPNTFNFDTSSGEYKPVSNNEISPILTDKSLNHTRAPVHVNYNLRFDGNKELNSSEVIQGE